MDADLAHTSELTLGPSSANGEPLSGESIVALCKKHTMFTWSAQNQINPIPIVRAQGIYFWDADGKRYTDMMSQLVCVNIGHSDKRVIDAIKAQADELLYVAPTMATRVRAEIGPLLASVTPGDLNTFFFTNGGAEATENSVRMARAYTGRHKVITRNRSYHGATSGAMVLSGEPRRWANEPGMPGIVRVADPYKYRSLLYREGDSDAQFAGKLLDQLEETIMYEGPTSVAAILMETVTGTNGLFIPPDGYVQGVRGLCDKYGIVMIADEVMCGFGRTGEWFAVDHWDVVPDIMNVAKGLTSAYLPLGAVCVGDKIVEFFSDRPYLGGLTYNSHPMSLAASVAAIKVMKEDDLVGNAKRVGAVMLELMTDLQKKHPSVGDVRSIGLFGCMELVRNRQTKEPMAPFNATSPEMQKVLGFFRENGYHVAALYNNLYCKPPLCITEAQLREAFEAYDEALNIADAAATN